MNFYPRVFLIVAFASQCGLWAAEKNPAERRVPDHLVPRRSTQIKDGFGINSDLPRDPYIPWNRWWWTRMFDAGINFIRIGQYENSSDYTSWDWVERRRGEYSVVPELEPCHSSVVACAASIRTTDNE